jgi:PAT family beta-lactamase induction signal transducer AmpG
MAPKRAGRLAHRGDEGEDGEALADRHWLDIYRSRRVLALLGLGFASGLPLALTGTTLQAWMSSEQVDLRVIGLFSLVGLPYSLKVLWAPFMDRFRLPWLGRRRGWIVLAQLLLGGSVTAMGFLSPRSAPLALACLALLVAYLSASQDIVVDAYRADVLEPRELGAGAATTVVGYRVALLVSGALALILSDFLPWTTVYLSMGLLMAGCAIFTLLAPEPGQAVDAPRSLREAVIDPLASYFRRDGAVAMLAFIMVYKLGDALAGVMTTPFLLDLGFTRTDVGTVNKAFGLISTIVGTLAGGGIVAHVGVNRSLWVFGFLQAVSNLAFALLAMVGKHYGLMVLSIGVENLCGGMGNAAFIAFMMSLCDKRYTATQYALLTSFMAVTRILAGVPAGFMAHEMGWAAFYGATVAGAVPGILLLPRFAPWRSRAGSPPALDGRR